ncbi:MAG: tRNA guanosine(34) transglycosylase Tgt [Solirubrobacteraceae bacterium]
MGPFTIEHSDPSSFARAGVLATTHGEVRTPAFVPLASTATVRGMLPSEVAALGVQMVLGNTFHLMLSPGPEEIAQHGGLHAFMGWNRPMITDSGGFQVFSLGHGAVADEVKSRPSRSRGDREGHGAILAIEEDGVRFRSYVDGGERYLRPEDSMEVQAALGSDIALVFDECTPFHVDRDYTARSTERTHRWLRRCLDWHAAHGPEGQLVYGIVQGGVYEDLRAESSATVAESGCDGVAIGGSLGAEKQQMHEVVSFALRELRGERQSLPRHLLGIGDIDDLIAGVKLGIDTFDCAMPTRLGRHGTALLPDPQKRWRADLRKHGWGGQRKPLIEGCRCEACAADLSAAYLSYLVRSGEITAMRLLTAHNVAFVTAVMAVLRKAILEDQLTSVAAALEAGASPFELKKSRAGRSRPARWPSAW